MAHTTEKCSLCSFVRSSQCLRSGGGKHTIVHRGLCAVVQSFSRVQLFAAPWTAACQASLSFTVSRSLLKLLSTELVTLSNHLILCHPLLLLLSTFPTSGSLQMSQLFASGGQSTGVSASISVLPVNTGLISFRMDWLDLLAVQETLKSLLQHHSSKASILRR